MDEITDDLKQLNINDKKKNKKNKHKDRGKDNNNKEDKEKPKEELTEEEKFREELNEISNKIKTLKLFFTKNESKNVLEDKIENFIFLEKIVDFNKIKQKIIEYLNSEDIFAFLFETWEKIINFYTSANSKNEKSNNIIIVDDFDYEEKDKKTKIKRADYAFNKMLMNLYFFVPKIISNTKDESFKNKITDTIFPNIHMIKLIEYGEHFLYYFINIFDIKDNLKKRFEKEYKEQFDVNINNSLCFGINLINLLDLQEMYPLEKIFKIISDNYILISYRTYSLLVKAYIKNEDKKRFIIIDHLFKLLEENKNLFTYRLVYDLINNDFKDYEKKNELILKFVKSLKINFDKIIRINSIENAIYYCKLIFENASIFDESVVKQARVYICEQYFNNLKPNEWKENLNKLILFEYNDLKDYLSFDNLETYYYKISLKNPDLIKILKFMPLEIPKILKDLQKDKNYEGGVKIIRTFDLPYKKVPEFFINERLYKFFNYKITVCKEENNPYTLIEYCLISQKTFDVSIVQLVNRYFKYYQKDKFFLYVINEVYYGAIDNKYNFNKKVKKEIDVLFSKTKYVDIYTFKDHFGPIEKNSMQINQKKTNVIFIDKVINFENMLKLYFVNSKYIGIDTEWQQSMKIKDEIDLSIMQLSTDDDKCCIILDMLKLKNDKRFIEVFKKYFTGKIFVGFSFDRNDFEVLPLELKDFFGDSKCCTVYDLVVIYHQKYLEKCASLKNVSEELLGESICKYEQCSDWNLRPLSKCQLHYAALDALICIKLYKKMLDDS